VALNVCMSLTRTGNGYSGRQFEQAQGPSTGHSAAAYARGARRVLQQVPNTGQKSRLSVHAASTQRLQQPVRISSQYGVLRSPARCSLLL